MSAQIRSPHLTLLLAAMLSALVLAGCGSEPAEAPGSDGIEITADEVPVIGNTTEDETADQPEEQPADETEDAGAETDEAADETDEAGDEATEDLPPPVPDDAEPADIAGDEEGGGFWSAIGGGLKTFGVFIAKLIFVLILPAAIAGTLLGMPGGVLVLADAVAFSAFHGWATPPWWVLVILLLIAVLAEAAENLLSFAGVKRGGASNTTGVWTMVGGLTGAVFGGILAPILSGIGALAGPVGWVILAIVPPIGFGMLGGFLGGYLFERHCGKSVEEAKKAGWGAMLGRFAGSFTKAMLVAVMAAVVLISTWGALF